MVRFNWFNWPEDLECGRQDHHGKAELAPRNQMDVINAQTANGKAPEGIRDTLCGVSIPVQLWSYLRCLCALAVVVIIYCIYALRSGTQGGPYSWRGLYL
jgi:hypothetical protein